MDLKQQMALASAQLAGFDIPTLPEEIMALQTLFQQSEFPDMAEVARIIERNTMLSGEVIKVANQPQFLQKGADPVHTIKGAVEALGLFKLKNLVLGLGFKTQISGQVFDELLEHTVDVANVAAELSHWVEGVASDEVYMAGIFHNAGAFIMEMKFQDYHSVFYNTLTNYYSGLKKEVAAYQASHGIYGLLVAKKWHLDALYAQIMLVHHQRDLALIKNDRVRLYVALVQLANAIVSEASFDQYIGHEVKEMKQHAQEVLMIPEDVVDEVRLALMSNSLV